VPRLLVLDILEMKLEELAPKANMKDWSYSLFWNAKTVRFLLSVVCLSTFVQLWVYAKSLEYFIELEISFLA